MLRVADVCAGAGSLSAVVAAELGGQEREDRSQDLSCCGLGLLSGLPRRNW